jgi:hypothetical protein
VEQRARSVVVVCMHELRGGLVERCGGRNVAVRMRRLRCRQMEFCDWRDHRGCL